ncbi:MAG: RNA polymerase sigma factor [Actinomycetes bacterium]
MALRKKQTPAQGATPTPVSEWSIADLSALYAEHRSSLTSQARRILRSESDAVEIVQEAFLKFIMAAPELDSRDRALAYLRTTVNNLCLNHIRATGSRPNLVAIDSETSVERINEIAAENHVAFDDTIAAAEDASIIREALSRLSADQRTALVMWEMEGRTTEEIAAELGTTPANVRHVVQRARASFVRVLTEWVVDEETGATALDALSTSYKKAAELAKKSSKVALSLVLLLAAFVGFNSFGNKSAVTNVGTSNPSATQELPAPAASASTSAAAASPSASATAEQKKSDALVKQVDAKLAPLAFYGLDSNGLPTGFTATDLQGHAGKIIVGSPAPLLTDEGTLLNAPAMTYDDSAVAVLLSQKVAVTGDGTTYTVSPSLSFKGAWVPLKVSGTSTNITRLPEGNYLVTSVMYIDSLSEAGIIIPVSRGVDVTSAPTSITTRLILNPGKTQILAQAIQVATKGSK